MKKIPLDKARKMMFEILKTSGAGDHDVKIMTDMRLEYDFHQNTFSGFQEIEGSIKELIASKDIKHKIVVDKPAMKLIDAQGRSAKLVGMDVCDLVIKMAKQNGIALVGIYNSTYHGILETYARKIAANDLIAIVSANGGPQGVVPHNGASDIFGTNPLSYGIPSDGLPIIFDGATAKYAYGSIRLAKEKGEKLPEKSYITKEGSYTTDPKLAIAIVPFGEHKGYAVNLLLEILTGTFVRAKMGLKTKTEKDLGSFFIAIDPSFFMPITEFKKSVSQLISDIQKIKPIEKGTEMKIPGYNGEKAKQRMIKENVIEVEDRIWEEFQEKYKKYCG